MLCSLLSLLSWQRQDWTLYSQLQIWVLLSFSIIVTLPSPSAYCLTQDEITAQALVEFNNKAATFPASTNYYLNQYLLGVPPNYPPYDGLLLTWGETYLGMVNLAMYQATRNTQYLENLLSHAEVMYSNRGDRVSPPISDQVRNTQMPTFVSYNKIYAPNDQRHSWLIGSSYQSYPVTVAISEIKREPQLEAIYGARADTLITDITQTMDSFDSEFSLISGGRGRYYDPYLHLLYPYTNGILPFNMQSGTGQAYIGLWKSTGDQRFYDRAVALAKNLKAEFTAVSDRYTWRYAPYDSAGSASDVSHAGLDVAFAVDAYEAGIEFDDTDIQRLVNTFRYIRRSTAFTDYVNGTGTARFDNIRLVTTWLPLLRYDAALREEMFPVFQSYWNTDCCTFPMLGAGSFYESGRYYSQESAFQESFDGLQLSPRWRRPPSQPISNSWVAQTTGSQLIVSDIKTNINGSWVDILKTRDVNQDGSWEVTFDFSWDSNHGSTNPLQAMQRFFVDLRDDTGALFGQVGISDGWDQQHGGRVIQLFDQSFVEPFGSLGPSGSASVRILSDVQAGVSQVYWNDNLMLSASSIANLKQVGMRFGHYRHFVGGQLRSHFGTISVNSIAVLETQDNGNNFVVFDGFDDGNRANTPNGINWFTHSHPNTALGLSVVDDSAGLGSGNALKVDTMTTGQSIMGVFDSPISLPETIGSKLTLRFEMRNQYSGGGVPGTVRFGLYDANETAFPIFGGFGGADGDWDFSEPGSRFDPGVFVQQDNDVTQTCCPPSATRIREESGQLGSQFGGGDERNVAEPSGAFPGMAQGNGKTIFTLEIERLAPGISTGAWRYTYTIDNGTTTGSLTGTHLGPEYFTGGITATGTFDYFSLYYDGVSGGLADFLIDNFSISVVTPQNLPGDYNDDGQVDALDYVIWRKNPNAHGGDPAGFDTWRANFGRVSGIGSTALVPEPTSLMMITWALMSVLVIKRRSHAVHNRLCR